jgi:hypothetical protein
LPGVVEDLQAPLLSIDNFFRYKKPESYRFFLGAKKGRNTLFLLSGFATWKAAFSVHISKVEHSHSNILIQHFPAILVAIKEVFSICSL